MSRKDDTTVEPAEHADDGDDDAQDLPAEQAGPSDVELIKQTLEGDRDAYVRLADRYYGWVFAMAAASLPNRDQAAQVARTVLVRAYKKLDRLDDALQFPAFLHRHLAEMLDAIYEAKGSQGKRRRSAVRRDVVERACRQAHKEDRAEFLYQYLRDLPHRFKTLLALKTRLELNYQQIASFVDMTPNAARGRLHQIKYKMARYLRSADPPTRRRHDDDDEEEENVTPSAAQEADDDKSRRQARAEPADENDAVSLDDILTDEPED